MSNAERGKYKEPIVTTPSPEWTKWDEFWDNLWHQWSPKKAITVVLLAGAAVYGCVELEQDSDAKAAQERKEVSAQLRKDDFPARDKGVSDFIDGRGIVDLSIGNCDFYGVSIEVIKNDGHITDLRNYSVPAGNGSVEVNFQNAEQLQKSLPSVDCFPAN